MRYHEPRFDREASLYIIWCETPEGVTTSLAAGIFEAVDAAWKVLQNHSERDELRLQMGGRLMRVRRSNHPGFYKSL